MISDEELEQLRYKGESADLDFKQGQYSFAGASDHEKSELAKDIMAMANAYRSDAGYILIGFKDLSPHPAEIIGISANDHIDDAALQQFVRSKIDPVLEFQYEERIFDGKHIAVITIPKQPRPFAPKQDFGKLRKNVALVRRGSSTDEASLLEMARMTLADAGSSKTARVELRVDTQDNDPLPAHLTASFLTFGELPDYEEDNWIDMGNGVRSRLPSMSLINRDYYRESAVYQATLHRQVLVRLSLANQSDFALGEVKLELACSSPHGASVQMLRADDLPEEPRSSDHLHLLGGFRGVVERLGEKVVVDSRSNEPLCHVFLGTLRPGETGRAEADIALLPSAPGNYVLRVRILAKELTSPIIKDHAIEIDGDAKHIELEDLESLVFGKYLDKAD